MKIREDLRKYRWTTMREKFKKTRTEHENEKKYARIIENIGRP